MEILSFPAKWTIYWANLTLEDDQLGLHDVNVSTLANHYSQMNYFSLLLLCFEFLCLINV
jgi:hypothetical protein